MKFIKEEEDNDEIIAIHLPLFNDGYVYYKHFMSFNDTISIEILLDGTFYGSPVLHNGNIFLREEDYYDPMFFNLVFERTNTILCGGN